MKIGYACKLVNVPNTNFKTCIQKNATEENLLSIIQYNIASLDHILEYNRKNNIHMFRIGSDFIPFGSSPVNLLKWWDIYANELKALGEKAQKYQIRLSMHPGQYTVLNSPTPDVVNRCIKDLEYHTKVLDSLGLSAENKMILHVGGAYGDKASAIERFQRNYLLLSDAIKNRLIIENDDKIYTIEEVLNISENCNIPVVFDNLHHSINHPETYKSEIDWIFRCSKTWQKKDGDQKIHYSQQAQNKRIGSHSPFISIEDFMGFYQKLSGKNIDIMLEVKDKNLSCLKCVNCTTPSLHVKKLEEEWSKYKYSILEKDPNAYEEIRTLLKNKINPESIVFYEIIEKALLLEENTGNLVNGFLHVWGYFKKIATYKEKESFFFILQEFENGKIESSKVKSNLKKLAKKYSENYLLNSYYFFI